MAASSTLLMRLLGGGGSGASGARRKERAKALLKHMYYNRRTIRLAAVALLCLLGLAAVWRVASPSSSSTDAVGARRPASLVQDVGPEGAAAGISRRKAKAAAAAAAVAPAAEEEEGDDDGWAPGFDDDDEKAAAEWAAAAEEGEDDDGDGWVDEEEEEEELEEEEDKEELEEGEGEGEGMEKKGAAAAAPAAKPVVADPEAERRRAHCEAAYGKRRYLEEDEYRVPPILYSYPGSGNTWVRLLIDYATGVYTGSILDDQSLVEALPGQGHCDQSVSAIKAHPNHFEPRRLFNLENDKDLDEEHEHHRRRAAAVTATKENAAAQKAEKGDGDGEEEEEEEEDMDELDMELEGGAPQEYVDEEEEEEGSKIKAGPSSFLRQVCLKDGDIPGFHRFILLFRNPYDAIWSEYQRKYKGSHHSAITRQDFDKEHFASWAPKYALRYVMMLNDFHAIERVVKRKNMFILKYESLKERSKRMNMLRKLVNFLGLAAPDPQRLGCADILADRPDTHRTAMMKTAAVASDVITKEEVYTPDVACMMWLIFGGRARKLGYTLPAWVKKQECRTMKYDWSLVLPGTGRRMRRKQKAAFTEVPQAATGAQGPAAGDATAKKTG